MKYFFISVLLGTTLFAAYLRDVPIDLTMPNGQSFSCFVSGDEFYNRFHDQDGYTIVQSQTDGYYYYAQMINNQITPSQFLADQLYNLESLGFSKGIIISKEEYLSRRERKWSEVEMRDAPSIGTVNNLNVFIRFADENEFGNARSYYDEYFNGENGPSMRDYFSEVSYEMLTVNTIHYPVCDYDSNLSYQDGFPRSYYQPYNEVTNPNGYSNSSESTQREHELLRNAISFIAEEVPDDLDIDADNNGYVDNVTFLVYGNPGGWAELLWPHRWALYTVESYINEKRVWDYNFNLSSGPYFSVGTLCHEFGHSIGAPDLYHYWDDAAPVAVGGWDLMDASTDIPQWFSAYIRYRYFDWIEPIDASGGGTFTLNPLALPDNSIYRLDSSNPNEYFIIEYRTQPDIYDIYAPGNDQGIVIYRVNNLYNGQGNANGPPDELYVYRTGGTLTSSGSFGGAIFSQEVGRTQFNDTTNPSAFLSDGSMSGINIVNIGSAGETIEFTVLNLMLLGNFLGSSSDSDGDGVLNPGETAMLEFNMSNMSDDIFAYGITGTLSSEYPITFPGSVIEFGDLEGSQSSLSHFVEIVLSDDILLGDIPISLEINAEYIQGSDLLFYNDSYTFDINISLNQSGFPNEFSFPIRSSPIMINVDDDEDKEIVFGDFDGKIRAFNLDGTQVENSTYPYSTENQIWGSPASADIDLDGVQDFIIGSKDKFLYFFDENGFKGSYYAGSFLVGTPSIGNIDDDPELEVVIGGYSPGDGRQIFAVNHDQSAVSGFPIFIGEKIKKGVALADFNGNGKDDIVFGTDSDNIYLLYDDGVIADGFPYATDGNINSDPVILDVDGDLLIIAGSNDDHLYAINEDGSLEFSFEAGDNIETSPSFLNYHNDCYIFFGDNDGTLYGLDHHGNLLPSFPINIGSTIIGSVVFSDLNFDTMPEIIFGTDTGDMYAVNLDGSLYNQMPISYPFSYHSAPIIYDIDGDLDLEIIAGTSLSINVFDIKQQGDSNGYWSMFRGSNSRKGLHQFTPLCEYGDINTDGNIDILDVMQQINFILDITEPSEADICAADLNADGNLDLLDSILLVNMILNP